MRRLLPWLLLALARTARSAPSTIPRDDLLARAAAIDAFFQNATAPSTWSVRSRDDVQGPYNEIYNKAKHVARAHVQGKRVVVQSGGPHEKVRTTNWGGGVLYMELVYMEALRGAPGIPELLGGWFENDGSLTYARTGSTPAAPTRRRSRITTTRRRVSPGRGPRPSRALCGNQPVR